MNKKIIATTSLAGCFGCHMSLLDIDEKILDLIELVEFNKSPIVDIKNLSIDAGVLNLIPEEIARKEMVIPLELNGDTLTLAMAFPDDIRTIRELSIKTGKRLDIAIASNIDIRNTIDLGVEIYICSPALELNKMAGQFLIDWQK